MKKKKANIIASVIYLGGYASMNCTTKLRWNWR